MQFEDFWLADQLTSLPIVLLDLHFMFCYLATEPHVNGQTTCGRLGSGIRPIIACLPAWWRFWQCLRRFRDSRNVCFC